MNLKGRSFIKLFDISADELQELIDMTLHFKTQRKSSRHSTELESKRVVGLLQQAKPHHRLLIDTAAHETSMTLTSLLKENAALGQTESVADYSRVMGQLYDAVAFEGTSQEEAEALVLFCGKPVISLGTKTFDPLQALADLSTIYEDKTHLQGLKLSMVGDCTTPQATSVFIAASIMGLDLMIVGPRSLWPSQELIADCKVFAKESGTTMKFTEDILEGTFEADVVFSSQQVSLSDSASEYERKAKLIEPYIVTLDVLKNADDQALFLHPLPANHDASTQLSKKVMEVVGRKYPHAAKGEFSVSNEVFYSTYSRVFDSFENRLHALKAVLYATLK